ncbi:hypothetical protein FE810_14105 [Thalassotalea litorea]|uniref:Uncharacterized protein n=1 Tax=Thalassotalea litorea TaxID=2020715 RepID=A0A5R9INR6_9GAMM|nr:hypothetical protein [Thalassotalea litorea]TLU61639.1 hypothetical protein FE810_14105 [Thalassotalea litorea]
MKYKYLINRKFLFGIFKASLPFQLLIFCLGVLKSFFRDGTESWTLVGFIEAAGISIVIGFVVGLLIAIKSISK